MRRVLRHRPSPALVVSVVALVIALGGTSYAAITLPRNSVGAKQIKKNAVTASKIRANAITSSKVKDGSLLTADFAAGQLQAGPKGDKGDKGDAGAAGADATKLWAKVDATTPSFVRSSGATGLEGPVALGLTGVYRIAFNRNVSGCVETASIAIDDGAVPTAGEIAVTNSLANPNAVAVTTSNSAGTAVNTLDFVVAVFC
jgi:hypothetical protein